MRIITVLTDCGSLRLNNIQPHAGNKICLAGTHKSSTAFVFNRRTIEFYFDLFLVVLSRWRQAVFSRSDSKIESTERVQPEEILARTRNCSLHAILRVGVG